MHILSHWFRVLLFDSESQKIEMKVNKAKQLCKNQSAKSPENPSSSPESILSFVSSTALHCATVFGALSRKGMNMNLRNSGTRTRLGQGRLE
jgi:hypothetical protein